VTIFFHDVSDYQSDWVPPDDTQILIARATMGDHYTDPSYQRFRQSMAKIGGKFIAYHWLHRGNEIEQARYCFDVVGADVPLMIDVEDMPNDTGYNGVINVAGLYHFLSVYRSLGGNCNLLYLPHWYWQDHMGNVDISSFATRDGMSLVSSNYTTYSDNGPGWAGYGGMNPTVWQFASTPLDTNAFRGTVQDFWRIARESKGESVKIYRYESSQVVVDGGQVLARTWPEVSQYINSGIETVYVTAECFGLLFALKDAPKQGDTPPIVSGNGITQEMLDIAVRKGIAAALAALATNFPT
jgi:hypothetical protein